MLICILLVLWFSITRQESPFLKKRETTHFWSFHDCTPFFPARGTAENILCHRPGASALPVTSSHCVWSADRSAGWKPPRRVKCLLLDSRLVNSSLGMLEVQSFTFLLKSSLLIRVQRWPNFCFRSSSNAIGCYVLVGHAEMGLADCKVLTVQPCICPGKETAFCWLHRKSPTSHRGNRKEDVVQIVYSSIYFFLEVVTSMITFLHRVKAAISTLSAQLLLQSPSIRIKTAVQLPKQSLHTGYQSLCYILKPCKLKEQFRGLVVCFWSGNN